MTQRNRVLALLQERGSVTPVDFLSPVADGGPPILRVAARIQELRDEGYPIETHSEPNGIARYELREKVVPLHRTAPSPVPALDASGEAGAQETFSDDDPREAA